MKGRKPTPPELKELRGNPGHRPMNRSPRPVGVLGAEPPAHLTPSQVAGWKYAIANAPPGVLTTSDRSNLVVWVVAEDYHRQASEKIAKEGLFLYPKKDGKPDETGIPYQHPAVAVVNRQAFIMLRAAAEMGFTPSSRSRVNVDDTLDAPGGEDNEFAEFAIN